MNKTVRFIIYTLAFLSMIIVSIVFTKDFGYLVTGSIITLILISACSIVNIFSGIVLSVAAPFFEMIFGFYPFLGYQQMAIIAVGNIILTATYAVCLSHIQKKNNAYLIAIAYGAILKYLFYYFGTMPFFIKLIRLSAKIISVHREIFGINQLFISLIGGFLAFLIVPLIKKAIKY